MILKDVSYIHQVCIYYKKNKIKKQYEQQYQY